MKLRTFALASIVALASPAAADIPVSPLGDIYETFNDCLTVADKNGISTDRLKSLGWVRATMNKADGSPVADGPIIYSNPKRAPVIVLSAERSEGMCMVMARIDSAATYPKFLEAWGPKLPKPDKEGRIGFYDEGHSVVIRQTGTAERPALTMAVMTPTEKK